MMGMIEATWEGRTLQSERECGDSWQGLGVPPATPSPEASSESPLHIG